MPETGDGTQGLAKKPVPVRLRAGETPALPGCARMPAHAGAFKGGVPGSDTRCAAFRWAFAPHFHDTLFPHGLRADRTFEQRCVFWRCNGQSALTPDPSPALRERGESEASLPRYDAVRGLYRTYFLSALESHKGRRGRLVVPMPETGDGTQGLPKNLPLQETASAAAGTGRRSAGVRLEKQHMRLLTVFASR